MQTYTECCGNKTVDPHTVQMLKTKTKHHFIKDIQTKTETLYL